MKLDALQPGDWFWHEKDGVKSRCMVLQPGCIEKCEDELVAVTDDGRLLDSEELPPTLEVLPARGPRG